MEILSLLSETRYHHQVVRKAFHHFLSLNNFQFDFSCLWCGHQPAVVVADANWKLAFDIPVSMFKHPDPDTVTEEDLQVDIAKAWDDLEKSLIAEGLLTAIQRRP